VARLQHLRETVQGRPTALQDEVQAELDLAAGLTHQAKGETTQATMLARAAKTRAHANRNRRRELEAACLLAASADDALHEALHIAASAGHVQPFLDILPFTPGLAARLKTANLKPALADIARQLIALLPGEPVPEPARDEILLSPRERDILQLLVRGQTNKAIARALNVAPETIKTHIKRIFQKLNVTNRAQAVSRYYQSRLSA
jgi:LuxR family maltose regulon positive regulatory protein